MPEMTDRPRLREVPKRLARAARRAFGLHLLDGVYGAAAGVLALLYSVVLLDPLGTSSLINVGYIAISWAFVLPVTLWRRTTFLAPGALLGLLAAWCAVWGAALPLNTGVSPWLLTVILAVYAPARYDAPPWWARTVFAAALTGSFLSPVMWRLTTDFQLQYRSGPDFLLTLAAHWGIVSVTFFVARYRAVQQHQRAERERSAREEERLAIAREIHDVLAHSLTLIKVQANAGLVAGQERQALEQIKEASSVALEEVRGVVGKLRGRHPAATVGDLPALVERSRAAGLTITATIADVPLAPAAERAVYRIVAESLTNALRHQASPVVRVDIKPAGEMIDITVLSTGSPNPDRTGSRTGLIGAHERARSFGGDLTAKLKGETFQVHATLRRFP